MDRVSDGGPELPPPLVSTETDWDGSVSVDIVNAVAAVSDVPPVELPTLNEVIDTDAVESLFSNAVDDYLLRFQYAGFIVTINGDSVNVHESML
jgi:hypothetical protein